MFRKFTIVGCALILVAEHASAQVTIQRPVFEQFSIGTTVSVPDRGRIQLGGIKRATSFRRQYGFFQPGSSIGHSRSYTGMSAGVYIMDLAEMDRMILGYDPATGASYYPAQTPEAQEQRKKTAEEITAERKPGLASAWMKLGHKAYDQGRMKRARDCFERARGYGSAEAITQLANLDRPKSLKPPTPIQKRLPQAHAGIADRPGFISSMLKPKNALPFPPKEKSLRKRSEGPRLSP